MNLVELCDGEPLFTTQPIESRVDEIRELGVGVHLGLKDNPGVTLHSTLDKQEWMTKSQQGDNNALTTKGDVEILTNTGKILTGTRHH